MGGQSEKKIQQNKEKIIGYYLYPTLISSGIYTIFNLFNGSLFTVSGGFLWAFLQIVSYFCYKQIEKSLELGLKLEAYSIYLDILVLNIVCILGSLISDYFLYLYMVIPGILLYKLFAQCFKWATNVEYEEEKGGKKEKKKEKAKRY